MEYNDNTLVAYKDNALNLEAFIEDGASSLGKVPVKELESEGCMIITFKDALERIEKAEEAKYINAPIEITAEEYDYALGCLPPENWKHVRGASVFRMSEYMTSNITAHYVCVNERYFTAMRRNTTKYEALMDEIMNLYF